MVKRKKIAHKAEVLALMSLFLKKIVNSYKSIFLIIDIGMHSFIPMTNIY